MRGRTPDWCRNLGPTVGGGRLYKTTRQINLPSLAVPPGTLFDASIPWLLRWWLDPHDPRLLLAAAAHDYALQQGHSRVRAALPFSEALRESGVHRSLRLALVVAVIVWKFR